MVSSRIVYANQWMQLREDVIERPDGSQGIYTYVEKPDFALIIPVEHDGFILLNSIVTRFPTGLGSFRRVPCLTGRMRIPKNLPGGNTPRSLACEPDVSHGSPPLPG